VVKNIKNVTVNWFVKTNKSFLISRKYCIFASFCKAMIVTN